MICVDHETRLKKEKLYTQRFYSHGGFPQRISKRAKYYDGQSLSKYFERVNNASNREEPYIHRTYILFFLNSYKSENLASKNSQK